MTPIPSFRTFIACINESTDDDTMDDNDGSFASIVRGLGAQTEQVLAQPAFWAALAQGLGKMTYIRHLRSTPTAVMMSNYSRMVGGSQGRGHAVYLPMPEWHSKAWQKAHKWSFAVNRRTNTPDIPTGVFVTANHRQSTSWLVGSCQLTDPKHITIHDARQYEGLYNVGDASDGDQFAGTVTNKVIMYLKHWE